MVGLGSGGGIQFASSAGVTDSTQARNAFISELYSIAKVNRLWLPSSSDSGTTTTELSRNEGTINWQDSTTAKDISTFTTSGLGEGIAYTFDGSNDNGELSADSDVDSYGDGANDSPFSGAALVNLTADTAVKTMISKFATSNREWRFFFDASEFLTVALTDESASGAAIGRAESSASVITPGTYALVGFSYDGSRVSSGCKLWGFLAGGSVRGQIDTADSESGTYVAMENLTQGMQIGARGGGGTDPFNGQMAMAIVYAAALTETQWESLAARVGAYHELTLV